ncbi:MAG: hypothetical protein IJY05_02215 [Clostridia bacterium]|nr:hypothetical protein [Clostridia bacterium]
MEREFEYEREKPVKKGGVLGKILMLLLGILLGIALTVGSVVGVGYWFTRQPLKKPVNMADKYIDGDFYGLVFGELQEDGTRTDGLLNAGYADKKVEKLISDISEAIEAISDETGTLEGLCEISPKLEKLVDQLLEKTDEFSIPFDKETIMTTPLTSLTPYIKETVKDAAVGDVITALDEDLSPLMLALCYGEENVHYSYDENGEVVMINGAKKTTFNDLIGDDLESLFDKVPVDAILPIDKNDTTMMAIAYGSSNRYDASGEKTVMKQVRYTFDNNTFYDDKDAIVPVTNVETLNENVYKLTLSDGSVEYVKAVSENAVLVYSDEACTKEVLYKKTMVGDLKKDSMALIDNIYLKDALTINAQSHKVLISLAFGEENVDYKVVGTGANAKIEPISNPRTIGQLRLKGGNLINEIPLADIMDDDKTSLTRYLLYGKKDVHYTVDASGNVTMLPKRIAVLNGTLYNEYGEKLSDYTLNESAKTYQDADGNEYSYVSGGLGTVKTEAGEAQLYYVSNANGLIYYKKTALGDMAGSDTLITNLTSRLTVSEVMDETSLTNNKFLKHVKDTVISDLPNAIEQLTIQQVFEEEIFETTGSTKTVKGEWWYMLHNEADCVAAGHTDPHTCTCVSDYGLKEMNTLIDNMKNNIHLSTLDKLSADGMLTFGEGMLNSKIYTEIKISSTQSLVVKVKVPDGNGGWTETTASEAFGSKDRLGLLTVEETIEYAEGLIIIIEKIDKLYS